MDKHSDKRSGGDRRAGSDRRSGEDRRRDPQPTDLPDRRSG